MKSTNVFLKSQNSIVSAAVIIAATTGLNALLGLIKGRLFTHYYGVSDQLAIFYTADRIPNMVYSLLVVGALSTVFIPIFSELVKKNREEASETASAAINISLITFTVLGTIAFIFAKQIIEILSLGQFDQININLGVDLMRIMLVGQFILILSSFISTVLQTLRMFVIPALAPVLYNIGMLVTTVILHEQLGIYAPAIGVVVGALLHILIQIPIINKTGINYLPTLKITKGISKLSHLVPYRILAVFAANSLQTINNSFAILISSSAVIHLKFATQLQTLPVSLFGASMSMAALPTLSAESVGKTLDDFKKTFTTSLLQMLYMVVPASIILIVLKVPVVRIVYGVSQFPWDATVKTSYALGFFGLSIIFQSVIYLLTRAFYALKDTKSPVVVSLATIPVNIALTYICITYLKLGVWSIAMTYTVTSFIDVVVLMTLLNKRVGGFDINALFRPVVKISYASLIMGLALYLPLKLLDNFVFDTAKTVGLVMLTVVAGTLGLATYLVLTHFMKVEEIQMFYKLLKKLNFTASSKDVILENDSANEK